MHLYCMIASALSRILQQTPLLLINLFVISWVPSASVFVTGADNVGWRSHVSVRSHRFVFSFAADL